MTVPAKIHRETELPLFVFAHDLRQCLRTIMVRAEIALREGEQLTPPIRLALEEITTAARTQEFLITSVTEYIQEPEMTAGLRLPLSLTAQAAIMEVDAEAKNKAARITLLPMPNCSVPSCMRLIFRKLLDNSLKFHKPGEPPVVSVGGELSSCTLSVFVSDNGIGVPAQFRDAVFTPFKTLHSRSVYPGCGMGLATCRKLVETLGGTIQIEGDEQLGALVRVNLPYE